MGHFYWHALYICGMCDMIKAKWVETRCTDFFFGTVSSVLMVFSVKCSSQNWVYNKPENLIYVLIYFLLGICALPNFISNVMFHVPLWCCELRIHKIGYLIAIDSVEDSANGPGYKTFPLYRCSYICTSKLCSTRYHFVRCVEICWHFHHQQAGSISLYLLAIWFELVVPSCNSALCVISSWWASFEMWSMLYSVKGDLCEVTMI